MSLRQQVEVVAAAYPNHAPDCIIFTLYNIYTLTPTTLLTVSSTALGCTMVALSNSNA
jgi:hypothetical protein